MSSVVPIQGFLLEIRDSLKTQNVFAVTWRIGEDIISLKSYKTRPQIYDTIHIPKGPVPPEGVF